MVKLDPATLCMPLAAQASRPSDPIQSFEAVLAEADQAQQQLLPPTAAFDELGMLGRYAATGSLELSSRPQDLAAGTMARLDMADVVASSFEARGSDEAPTAGRLGPATATNSPGVPVRADRVAHAEGMASPPPVASGSILPGRLAGRSTQFDVGDSLSAAGPPLRPAAALSGRQAPSTTRIDVTGPGHALQIALVAAGLGEDGHDRLRRMLADIAAELGLHLAEFSLNGQTVAAPGVGALGGPHGRIRG
jgi:hypothetical protein